MNSKMLRAAASGSLPLLVSAEGSAKAQETKGDGNSKVVSQVAGIAWDQCISLCILVWFDRAGHTWAVVIGRQEGMHAHLMGEAWLGAACWGELLWPVLSRSQWRIVYALPGRADRARMRPGRKREPDEDGSQEKA